MLQLKVDKIDIATVTKLLFKYPLKAKVTEQEIILYGSILDEVLSELCVATKILAFSNFISEENVTTTEKLKKAEIESVDEIRFDEFCDETEQFESEDAESETVSEKFYGETEEFEIESVESESVSKEFYDESKEFESESGKSESASEEFYDESKEFESKSGKSESASEEFYDESEEFESESAESESVSKEFYDQVEKTDSENVILSSSMHEEYDLIYSNVERGEIYWCDFGEPYGSEQGRKRPAIVVQNNTGNLNSPTTIVIPLTTAKKNRIPTHCYLKISSNIIVKNDYERNLLRNSVVMAEQIQTVDKTRLREYIGKCSSDFMKALQEYIDISLGLCRETKTIVEEKIVYVSKPAIREDKHDKKTTAERRDINMAQIQVLSFVNINELLEISRSDDVNEIKVKKLLDLFGFDFEKKGVRYLQSAICMAPENEYFDLDILADRVSNVEDVEKEEIKRVIIARIKENFGLKKSIAIDFIRLVTSFLQK